MYNQWLLDRCKEVQAEPDGYLDLWARGHYKSTIITLAKTIQDVLNNPETTVGIFSCTRPIAKQFLRQIKREFESNQLLRELFPDILWNDPHKEAPKWSEDDGIIVKRKSNPKESTIEAWGIVEGQPISKHFHIKVYDDLITLDYVSNPEMIERVTNAWALSLNLGSTNCIDRYIGTRYHFNDTYKTMIERGTVKPRVYAATKDGLVDGESVLMNKEQLEKKYRDMGSYVFSAQMLQNPVADTSQGFRREWLRYYVYQEGQANGMNVYILIDPANDKKKKSDYTAMWVIGLASDSNYYVLDMVRDKLNLTERCQLVMDLHRKWKKEAVNIMGVGYEQYGMQADIQYLEQLQAQQNYRFGVTPLGGKLSKSDRIKKLIPVFEQNKIYLPQTCFKTDYEKKTYDLVDVFINQEYLAFPVALHDDMLDDLARILDEDLACIFPQIVVKNKDGWATPNKYRGSSWTV